MRNYFNCMLSVACILFIACRQPKGYMTVDDFPVTQKMACQEVCVSPNLFLPVGSAGISNCLSQRESDRKRIWEYHAELQDD